MLAGFAGLKSDGRPRRDLGSARSGQRVLRSACVFAHSDRGFRCTHEKAGPLIPKGTQLIRFESDRSDVLADPKLYWTIMSLEIWLFPTGTTN